MSRFRAWMKKRRYYILAALAGAAMTPGAVQAAYEFRGYRAFGSEYLIIPLMLLLVGVAEGTATLVKEVMLDDDAEIEREEDET